MWLVTNVGFFSIVERPEDVDLGTLTVRARIRSDLESLRLIYLPKMTAISETHDSDYRFRAKVDRHEVSKAMAKMIDGISYNNFKNEVREVQGYGRAMLYSKVWSKLYQLQQDHDAYENDPSEVANQMAVRFCSGHCAVLVSEDRVLVRTMLTADIDTVFWQLNGRVMGHPQQALLSHVYHVTGYEAKVAVPCSIQAPDPFADWGHYIIHLPPVPSNFAENVPAFQWMTFSEAVSFIASLTNTDMRARDMMLLKAVKQQINGLHLHSN